MQVQPTLLRLHDTDSTSSPLSVEWVLVIMHNCIKTFLKSLRKEENPADARMHKS